MKGEGGISVTTGDSPKVLLEHSVCCYAGRRINPHLFVRYQQRFGLTESYLAFVLIFIISNFIGLQFRAGHYKFQTAAKPWTLQAIMTSHYEILKCLTMKFINALIIITSSYALGFAVSCKKDSSSSVTNPPVVTTNAVTNISSTSVVSGGTITNATNITDSGIVWGIDSNMLTVANSNKISNGVGQSNFADTIQNLQANTNYYVKAYAVYSAGTSYGATIKFITLPPQPILYVAGFIDVSSIYWKNNIAVSLTNSGYLTAWAHSIYVAGNNVYAAGEQNAGGGNALAVYWKNGTAVPLTDGSNYAVAYSIYVVGNDIYVAGYELLNGRWPVAKYWKNGVAMPLTGGTIDNNGIAYSICVEGSDVYIAGFTGNQYMGYQIPTYWKNGIAVPLLDSNKATGVAQSIFVDSSKNVYVAGSESSGVGISFSGVPVAKYWKNGISVPLTDGSQPANAYSIYVNRSNVYACGFEYDGLTGFSVAKYWKNGTAFSLTDANRYASAEGIFVAGDDVYVAGREAFSPTSVYFHAKYWKNGVAVTLDSSSNESYASSIFVQ